MRLEIAVQDVDGIQVARDHGADRAELCQALATGGLTPTAGMILRAVELGLPARPLIRPRAGGYLYSAAEVAAMRHDVRVLREAGADGVIVGALDDDGLDHPTLRRLIEDAEGLPVVVHRCVDVLLAAGLTTPQELIEELVDLGISGVLTSGGATTAPQGVSVIGQLAAASAGRVEIIAGGGVRAEHVATLAEAGADVVHLSAGAAVTHGSPGPGGGEGSYATTDPRSSGRHAPPSMPSADAWNPVTVHLLTVY